MTAEEIAASVAEIGCAKTYEILAALHRQERQQQEPDVLKLDWQQVIKRNQRDRPAAPAPVTAPVATTGPALSLFDAEAEA